MFYKNLPGPHVGTIFENGHYSDFSITCYEHDGRDGLFFRLKIGNQVTVFFVVGTAVAQMHKEEIQVRIVKFRRTIIDNTQPVMMKDIEVFGLNTHNMSLLHDVERSREQADHILGSMLLEMDYAHDEGAITYDVFRDSTELTLNQITSRLEYFHSRGWFTNQRTDPFEPIGLAEAGRTGIKTLLAKLTNNSESSLEGNAIASSIPSENIRRDIFICYPSPLRELIAKPLNEALLKIGMSTWFDSKDIDWGAEFLKEIQKGLLASRYAIIVVGLDSAGRYYQEHEIQSIQKLESTGSQMILPLLHEVSMKQFADDFPFLSNKQALTTERSFQEIADLAKRIVSQDQLYSS